MTHGFDPLLPGEESQDPDTDGLDNLGEQAAGADPHDQDSDGDGFLDGEEVAAGTDPLDDQDSPIRAVPALGPGGTILLAALLAASPWWLRRRGSNGQLRRSGASRSWVWKRVS